MLVAIIALLISILLPSLGQAKEQAKKSKCGANLRSLGQAVAACYTENNEFGPSWDDGDARFVTPQVGSYWMMYSWVDTLFDMGYLGSADAQICPDNQRPDEVTQIRSSDPDWPYQFVREFWRGETPRAGIRTSYALNCHMHFNFREDRFEDPARQVYAIDGWWTWFGSLNAAWVMAPVVLHSTPPVMQFLNPWASMVGWRHGPERAAMVLFRDGHVMPLTPRSAGLTSMDDLKYETVDTSRWFTWLPGESPTRKYAVKYGEGSNNPHRVQEWVGKRSQAWLDCRSTGRGAKWIVPRETVGTENNNFHPYAYPEELNAVWRTQDGVWNKLPNSQGERR